MRDVFTPLAIAGLVVAGRGSVATSAAVRSAPALKYAHKRRASCRDTQPIRPSSARRSRTVHRQPIGAAGSWTTTNRLAATI